MAASKLASQYQNNILARQFSVAAEDISYVPSPGNPAVTLKGVVLREPNQEPRIVDNETWETSRAMIEVYASVDPIYGGIVIAEPWKFKYTTNFSIALFEGGPLVSGWIVDKVTGETGTWQIEVVREVRIETGGRRQKG